MAIDKTLIDQLLADYKKPEDIIGENGLLKQLTKAILERALQAELTDHLGFEKHDPAGHHSGNTRNGASRKALKGDFGELELETPRDRKASFEPKIVAKGQARFTGFDDKIISMYARGMSTREIQGHLEEIYGIEVSPTLISNVTEAILEEVKAWQSRPLEELYPIVYLDAMMVKIRDSGHVQNQAIYVVLGVDLAGQKEVLGLWTGQQEGAKFWLQVLTELKNRGVKDILIACVDGLKGFPEAIETIYPHTEVQLCIVHLVRASLNYVPWKHRKLVAADLRRIYRAATDLGSDRNYLSPHRSAALHRASGAGFAELCALEAPQISGGRSAADLSCGHRGRSHATSGGGNSQVECVSQREPSMAAELGSHHAFFPLSRRHSQGDLYDQQRGGTASLAAQDHQNAWSFSPRGVSAEVAISGDPPGVQEVDHAGEQLEPSLELLHRPLARAHAQAGQVGIMHLSSFLRGDAREGEMPPSLATHPQKQPQPQKQSLVVYTEDWTQPSDAPQLGTSPVLSNHQFVS